MVVLPESLSSTPIAIPQALASALGVVLLDVDHLNPCWVSGLFINAVMMEIPVSILILEPVVRRGCRLVGVIHVVLRMHRVAMLGSVVLQIRTLVSHPVVQHVAMSANLVFKVHVVPILKLSMGNAVRLHLIHAVPREVFLDATTTEWKHASTINGSSLPALNSNGARVFRSPTQGCSVKELIPAAQEK